MAKKQYDKRAIKTQDLEAQDSLQHLLWFVPSGSPEDESSLGLTKEFADLAPEQELDFNHGEDQ